MIFNTGYYHPMDRDYEGIGLSPKNIGIPTHPAKDQLEGLKASIFQGASRVELGFFGAGKGSRGQGQATPESYGADERLAMKELARINKIKLSTHASPSVAGFAGLGRQELFDENERERNINEVKKAIDFAADVAEGGPVVLHTGEFPRSIYGGHGKEKFRAFEDEPKKMVHYLVDDRTGKMINAVKEDEEAVIPVQAKDELTGEMLWETDDEGNFVRDKLTHEKVPVYKTDSKGNIEMDTITFHQFAEEGRAKGQDDAKIAADFLRKAQFAEIEHNIGQAMEYEKHYTDARKERDKIKEAIEFYKHLKSIVPKDKWDLYKKTTPVPRQFQGMIDPETDDPIERLREVLKDNERRVAYGREIAVSGRKRAQQLKESIDRATSITEYGIKKTADSIAKLAKFAIDQEKAKGINKDGKNPLVIAPESYAPEQYGGHPDELKRIIQESRKKFVEKYKADYGEEKAKKLADSHIKATFDIGHAYIWKKYFQGSDKDFHKWFENKVDDLLKSNVIGHVHISDNFGYDDEHLTPGEGIIGKERLKAFIEKIKKAGIKDVIVEPAGQPGGEGWRAMLGGWAVFGSPIYGAEKAAWTNVSGSYFGRTTAPNYIFGEYAPSNEFRGQPFWSGLGLE